VKEVEAWGDGGSFGQEKKWKKLPKDPVRRRAVGKSTRPFVDAYVLIEKRLVTEKRGESGSRRCLMQSGSAGVERKGTIVNIAESEGVARETSEENACKTAQRDSSCGYGRDGRKNAGAVRACLV